MAMSAEVRREFDRSFARFEALRLQFETLLAGGMTRREAFRMMLGRLR